MLRFGSSIACQMICDGGGDRHEFLPPKHPLLVERDNPRSILEWLVRALTDYSYPDHQRAIASSYALGVSSQCVVVGQWQFTPLDDLSRRAHVREQAYSGNPSGPYLSHSA